MSYQTWYREDPWIRCRWGQSGAGTGECIYVQPGYVNSYFWSRYHEVTSWRGKRESIRVGSKRRQVYRQFEVRKQEYANQGSTWMWCPASGYVARGVDLPPARLLNTWNWIDTGTMESAWEGTRMPVYSYEEHQSIGEAWRDEVILDLWAKSKEPRFDSAVFLGELGETLTSVKGLFVNAVKAFTKARKAIDSAKYLALNSEELWLWYRYFLLPAMLDAENLLSAIKPQARIDRVQAGKLKKTFHKSGYIHANGWWASKINATYLIPWTQEITVSAGGAMDILKRLDTSEWGTSAVDCLRAGWEVIPFSFVFDWFVNMGDFLQTLRNVELDIAQSYCTYAVESKTKLHAGPNVWQSKTPHLWTLAIVRQIDLEPPDRKSVV